VNHRKARKYARKACEVEKAAPACRLLALIYLEGIGTKARKIRAIDWFEKACELGDVEGCYSLGGLIFNDLSFGDKLSSGKTKRACGYIRRACTLGHKKACKTKTDLCDNPGLNLVKALLVLGDPQQALIKCTNDCEARMKSQLLAGMAKRAANRIYNTCIDRCAAKHSKQSR
tara:strand:- start:58 stop:576 length:519 start_codon:yes stop_codon:yes gene_type:complete